MSEEERDRIGRFFLKPDPKWGTLYIRWYDPATRQTAGVTTGTRDRETARRKLAEHALKAERPAISTDAQLAAVMQAYYIHYAQHLPSAHTVRAAMRDALDVWGDPNIGELTRTKQLELVTALRSARRDEKGNEIPALSDWTIDGRLNRIWAAINWSKRDNKDLVVPEQITAADWKPILEDREHTYSLEELAALFDAAAGLSQAPGSVCENAQVASRYTREHWWRFLVLAIGTLSREAAIRELTWSQIDLRLGRIRLNPEGRRQTKKRRATVPIAPTLAAELASWERQGDHVITYYGKPLATREFYDLLAEKAGVTGGPNTIRHTVRTWLSEFGVPDSEADVAMGHKSEGSATGKRYIHRRPEYLKSVVEGIEALYAAIGGLTRRPFKGREVIDQPMPVRVSSVQVETTQLVRFTQTYENSGGLERETRLELATPTLARLC